MLAERSQYPGSVRLDTIKGRHSAGNTLPPRQFAISGGSQMPRVKYIKGTPTERLFAYIKVQDNGCWEWIGYVSKNGYGSIKFERKVVPAHRFSYQIFKGPIPEGMDLDHICHDPKTCDGGKSCPHRRCVNPDHLEPTTDAVNCSKERSVGNRGDTSAAVAALKIIYQSRTSCPKGHPKSPGNTLTYQGIGRCRECNRIQSQKTNQKNRRNREAA